MAEVKANAYGHGMDICKTVIDRDYFTLFNMEDAIILFIENLKLYQYLFKTN